MHAGIQTMYNLMVLGGYVRVNADVCIVPWIIGDVQHMKTSADTPITDIFLAATFIEEYLVKEQVKWYNLDN